MILAPRKHLFATNIIFLIIILIVQKFIRIFCIIEKKTCGNDNCTPQNRCEERCAAAATAAPPVVAPPSPPPVKGLRFIPSSLCKTMQNFGYGEGHFQIFVEEKQRQHSTKSRLNAAVAEVKLNPN